jgi:phosphohistidine swiveling domain-containing protein
MSMTGSDNAVAGRCLKRLQQRAQGREWVKGAVNYDEDLHFSTYYLRASCSGVTLPLNYPGYSCIVASYEGFHETYYLLKEECRESAVAIVERALRQPRWLPGIVREIRRRSDALADIFRPETSAALLARLPDARILALYRRHDAYNRSLYQYARLPEALDRGVSYFTTYLMEHLRHRGIAASACAEVFDVLSQPVTPSVLAQEIVEFDEIVRRARAHSKGLPQAADGLGRGMMLLEPGLFRRLEAHREKWQFLPYHGYGRRELATLEHYLRRLLDQTRNPTALADGADLMARCEQGRRKRQELLGSLKLDRCHVALFEVYPEIGAVKLYRRYAQLRNFYYLDMLLAEIGRRLDVSEWTVRCMLPEEVMASLRSHRLASRAIRERLAGCIYTMVDGREQVVTGEVAETVRLLVRPTAQVTEQRNVLRGVVACRGRAAGPCRVIIRADDCQAGFVKGSIIASESTDPDLVPLLRAAGGVLTEQGGVTSHAAIICRELGIPTIIGIEGLLERVHDGDWLEMDAEDGIVTMGAACQKLDYTAPPEPPTPSPGVIGAKAYNLGLIRSLGFRVPEYVLLDCDEVRRGARRPEGPLARRLVRRVLSTLALSDGEKLAVRSSSVCEDQEDGSGAGLYRSLLHVEQSRLAAALRDFVASNQARRGAPAYRGSVIVQRMVQADCAGVCLTNDGRTGNRHAVIIEMAAGGNAGVTGGTVRPDRLVVDRLTGDILEAERRCPVVRGRAVDVTGMVRQFLTLESRFGKPLDIEWALAGRELYILQARPIVNGHRAASGAGASTSTKL